jgi:hypothetical protein
MILIPVKTMGFFTGIDTKNRPLSFGGSWKEQGLRDLGRIDSVNKMSNGKAKGRRFKSNRSERGPRRGFPRDVWRVLRLRQING